MSDDDRARDARAQEASREAIRRSRALIESTPTSLQEQIARRAAHDWTA